MLMILATLATAAAEPSRPECRYDREVELARPVVAFDQTEGQGWRPLYDAQCYIEAAELLREWRARHENDLDLSNPREGNMALVLAWHEAQMWAFGGQIDIALPMFEASYREVGDLSGTTWNLYVDGTLAFLRQDRPALEVAIAKLAVIPKPPGWDSAVGQDGKPISVPWPQNLDVLQGLARCWEQTYSVAYVCRDIPKLR